MFNDDTIVALSTAPGTGAIAVIRLSGRAAIAIMDTIFSKKLSEQPTHSLHHGYISDNGSIADEVVAGIFRAPHSYTGEDVVELSTHGSPLIVQQIIRLLIIQGARAARAGEFTQRAFLNGKMDLSQAEAVADLIAADSALAQQTALKQMRGGFSAEIKMLRDELIHLAALLELELDFSEEDAEFASRHELRRLLDALTTKINRLQSSFALGQVIKNGVATVIAGRPNAGKSTLLNALLNEERAIVSDIPGTTRDAIEEVINISGVSFRFIDTAGIREATDVIEKMGVEKTLEKIRRSALVLYVFDVNELSPDELKNDLSRLPNEVPVIAVGNKTDAYPGHHPETLFAAVPGALFISARQRLHLDLLKERIASLALARRELADQTIVTNARHYEALSHALDALNKVQESLEAGHPQELLAADVRRALDALGAITGEVSNDEILGAIFAKFCIGK